MHAQTTTKGATAKTEAQRAPEDPALEEPEVPEKPEVPEEPEEPEEPKEPEVPDSDPKDGVFLRRTDGKIDLIMTKYPSLPVRIAIHSAFRRAIGYVESDEPGKPTGEYCGEDATACLWAAIGASWAGPDVGLPTLREHQRDVIAYGEAVTTALAFAGYGDIASQIKAGRRLHEAYMQELNDAESGAREVFRGARRPR